MKLMRLHGSDTPERPDGVPRQCAGNLPHEVRLVRSVTVVDVVGQRSEGGTDRLLFCAAVFPALIVVVRAVLQGTIWRWSEVL